MGLKTLVSTKNSLNEILLPIFGFSVLIFSIVCYYSAYNEFKFDLAFNSDTLGVPTLFKDIFHDNGKIKDWYLAAAPTLFPDMSLYFVLFKIFDNDFLLITFLYGLIQTLAIVFLSYYIFRRTFNGKLKKYSWLVPVFYSLVFLESYYFTQDQFFAYLMTVYCFHSGAFVNALIALAVLVSNYKLSFKYLFLFFYSILAAYSDMLYIVMFTAPLFFTNVFLFKQKGLKYTALISILVVAGSLIGLYIYNYINENGYFHFSRPNSIYQFDNIKPSLKIFYDQTSTYIGLYGFRSFQMAFAFISPFLCALILLVLRKKIRQEVKYFLTFYIFFSFAVYAAPIINGNYTGWDTIRYNIAPIFFAMTVLALFVGYAMERFLVHPILNKVAGYSIILFFVILIGVKFSSTGLNNYFSYYPPKVRVLDSVCVKHNLKRGVSYYWYAKWMSIFSKQNIEVVCVYPAITINEFGTNISSFYKGTFDFVLPYRLDSGQVSKSFEIIDTIKTENLDLIKVKPFYFPANQYAPKVH